MTAAGQAGSAWLAQLVGEWAYEGEGVAEPDGPAMTFRGTERVRSLGGAWIVGEGATDGSPTASLTTLGYDAAKDRVVGTFVGTMSPHLWVYDGRLDAAAGVLTLDTEGPSFVDEGAMGRYRDTIELTSDGGRVQTSHFLRDDGTWYAFMTMRYRRAT